MELVCRLTHQALIYVACKKLRILQERTHSHMESLRALQMHAKAIKNMQKYFMRFWLKMCRDGRGNICETHYLRLMYLCFRKLF